MQKNWVSLHYQLSTKNKDSINQINVKIKNIIMNLMYIFFILFSRNNMKIVFL